MARRAREVVAGTQPHAIGKPSCVYVFNLTSCVILFVIVNLSLPDDILGARRMVQVWIDRFRCGFGVCVSFFYNCCERRIGR